MFLSASIVNAQTSEPSKVLAKEALTELLTGAQIELISTRGNRLSWVNEPNGEKVTKLTIDKK